MFHNNFLAGERGVVITECSLLHVYSVLVHVYMAKRTKNSSKFKRTDSPWKIMESRFPGNMHTFTLSLKYHKKIPKIIGNSLRGIVLQKKTELTDWLTDGSNISYPSQLLVLSIIVINKNVFHYQNGLLKLIVREPIK